MANNTIKGRQMSISSNLIQIKQKKELGITPGLFRTQSKFKQHDNKASLLWGALFGENNFLHIGVYMSAAQWSFISCVKLRVRKLKF